MEKVVHENAAAAKRLAGLALTTADLIGALTGADTEARRWTPLAPPMMAGLARWGKTNELLRARLVTRGWRHDSLKGMPRTISPARDFAIVATTGDAVTGHPDGSPSTKYAKGIQTVRAVGRNVQLAFDLPGLYPEAARHEKLPDGVGSAVIDPPGDLFHQPRQREVVGIGNQLLGPGTRLRSLALFLAANTPYGRAQAVTPSG